ncbi:MAG: hypothetical protein J7K23_04310 [Thermoproteales archaeon]|nr:hypothetical protein [Thermoproteales archaeon]
MNIEIILILSILIASIIGYTFLSSISPKEQKTQITIDQLYIYRDYLESGKSISLTGRAYIEKEKNSLTICYEESCFSIQISSVLIYWKEQGFIKDYNISSNKLWQIYGNHSIIGIKSGVRINKIGKTIKIEIVNLPKTKKKTINIVIVNHHTLKILKVATNGKIFFNGQLIYKWYGIRKIVIVRYEITT